MRRIASQDVAKRSDPMKKPKYTPEIRDRAVQLLIEFEKRLSIELGCDCA
jgi:transposase